MVLLASYRGNVNHAPENSRAALVSAFTSGADVLEFDVQLTKDGQPVVVSPTAMDELSDAQGKVQELSLAQLRAIDFGAKFKVGGSVTTPWKRQPPLARIETLGGMLDQLPEGVIKVLQVHLTVAGPAADFVKQITDSLQRRGLQPTSMICSTDLDIVRTVIKQESGLISFLVCGEETGAADLQGLRDERLDGLVLNFSHLLNEALEPTPFAAALRDAQQEGLYPHGVIVRTQALDATLSKEQYRALAEFPFVYAVSVRSPIEVANSIRKLRKLGEASFAGEREEENSGRFHFGYAKANRYAHIYQKDGVNIDIKPYEEPPPIHLQPSGDEAADRLNDFQEQLWAAARNWPFYSGGGFGTAFGIDGDFVAEVDFSMEVTSQATMCEMAATNVDPAKHRPGWKQDKNGKIIKGADGNPIPNVPGSFRDIDTFFDPHGAPPFVGVEHDEDDGYRINYNLGTQYENNQYGRPHGNGNTKRGRFRLERRGPYFSAYYKDEENPDWVSCGVCRNDSLNRCVFIRCAGKRWRQESDPDQPGEFFPIPHNHIIFRNFVVWTVLP